MLVDRRAYSVGPGENGVAAARDAGSSGERLGERQEQKKVAHFRGPRLRLLCAAWTPFPSRGRGTLRLDGYGACLRRALFGRAFILKTFPTEFSG